MAPIANNGPPPSSETLTYDYRNSMRGWDIVTQVVCLVIGTICVALRMCSKLFIVRKPGWEDLSCFLAWLGLIGYGVICFEADKHGSGIHQWLVAEIDARSFSKIANIAQIAYGPLIFITKLSILLLYIRLFTTPVKKTTTYMIIQLLIWFNFFFYLADTIVKIFECTPRHKIWEKTTQGSCININIPILVTSAINVASDFMILLLPIACVWNVKQMNRTRKLGVSAIFAAGSFGCCSSVVRLVFSVKNSNTADKTHDWFPEFLWTTAEVTCGIIASCLPALPACFRYFFQKAATQLSCFSEASAGSSRRRHHNNANISPSQQEQQNKKPPRGWMATEDSEVLKYSTWELEGNYSNHDDSNNNSKNGSNTNTTKSNSNANTNSNTNTNNTNTNTSSNNTTELRSPAESQSQIFQGASYSTAEAKADATPLASTGASPDASCVDIEKTYPSQGILRTIEVDVESAPGKGQGQGQGQGQK